MTAILPAPAEPPAADLHERLREGLESAVVQWRDGEIADEWVMVCMRDWRPDLASWDRWALWEEFDEADKLLRQIRDGDVDMPMVEPEARDLDTLEHAADRAVMDVVRRIGGFR